ncbi:MAG: branched-chain amino acid ABC transporter permease [Bdellovibrionales bacterium]|nr:branched-chain amino acid ABC transporter permease [Bdellovibrionales bacterium]
MAWEYIIHLSILICIYSILAQSFNLNFGLANQFNLAHISSYAIGAYTTALLSTEHQCGMILTVFSSMAASGIFALLVGAISFRLTQDYFAIGTLAFSAFVSAIIINWKSLTRGVLGIPGIPRPELLDVNFYDNGNLLTLFGTGVVISHLFFSYSFGAPIQEVLEDKLNLKALPALSDMTLTLFA